MPLVLPLEPINAQQFTTRLDGRLYRITLRELNAGVMGITIERDGVLLMSNQRCVAGSPVIPYPALARDAGNFIFTNTQEGAIPTWQDFGTSCFLVYSTAAEIAQAVAGG